LACFVLINFDNREVFPIATVNGCIRIPDGNCVSDVSRPEICIGSALDVARRPPEYAQVRRVRLTVDHVPGCKNEVSIAPTSGASRPNLFRIAASLGRRVKAHCADGVNNRDGVRGDPIYGDFARLPGKFLNVFHTPPTLVFRYLSVQNFWRTLKPCY
jgi:hypothetical protein